MIRKQPTNSEMNAKTRSGVPMNVLIVELGALLGGCRGLLSGLRLGVAREGLRDALAQLDVGDAALRADEDAVVFVLTLEHALGGRFGEQRDGGTRQVARAAVSGDAGDREVLLDPALEHDRQRLSDDQIVFGCGPGVHDHVAGTFGSMPAAQSIR